MLSLPIKKICILGGGTAGWLSAVYLQRALNGHRGSHCEIAVVESSDIGTVGVGEATIPTFSNTLSYCDISERDWMIRCNATYKLGIKFVKWSGRARPDYYWHVFDQMRRQRGLPLSYYWQKQYQLGRLGSYSTACSPAIVALCEARKSPRMEIEEQGDYKSPFYAYHLDAGLFANYLRGIAKERGVYHIVDNVLDVYLDGEGNIGHLSTEHYGALDADLFLDCSGFSGRLINVALGEPFIPYTDALFCDRAIALPMPSNDANEGINPYTTATALGAGWVWHTPLFGRSGNGYVYSSAFLSEEEAEEDLRTHLGPRSRGIESHRLKMRVGRTRSSWVKNCVSIGLASGFIEPLESTGIALIELGISSLIQYFPGNGYYELLRRRYNETMRAYYEQIRDFVLLHYCTTSRQDTPFWKANKHHSTVPETLKERLDLWRSVLPNDVGTEPRLMFSLYSWTAIIAGMGQLPRQCAPVLNYAYGDESDAHLTFMALRAYAEKLVAERPDHYEYLCRLRRCAGR